MKLILSIAPYLLVLAIFSWPALLPWLALLGRAIFWLFLATVLLLFFLSFFGRQKAANA